MRSSFESTVGDGSRMECTTEEARGVLGSRCGSELAAVGTWGGFAGQYSQV